MQNDKIKKKSKSQKKKSRKKNFSQPGLTRLTRHPWYEIRIKKLDFQKKDLVKKIEVKKKSKKKKPELTLVNLTNLHSR